MQTIETRLAQELSVGAHQVSAAVELLDDGATVPFVARYRKEATNGLDDTQLRKLQERLSYLRELEDRRGKILETIAEQGKLTDALRGQIQGAATKVALEDLYLPYRPRRRTKAQIAREAGLEPLAERLLEDPALDPEGLAREFTSAAVADTDAALAGARAILIERFAEDAAVLGKLRDTVAKRGFVVARVAKGKTDDADAQRFRDYFEHDEPIARVPSHRALAMLRARKEGAIDLCVGVGDQRDPLRSDPGGVGAATVAARFGIENRGRRGDPFLAETAQLAFKSRIAPHLETELLATIRDDAEAEAIEVFGSNLRDLLLAAPAGQRVILGLDPGLRTGVKVAVVDRTGKLVETATIYPHAPRNDWIGSIEKLAGLCGRHGVELIAIGNGTASRETDKLAAELIRAHPDLKLAKLIVSEAGASVYSASEGAACEFPDVDVSLRGAVSIARRLQDPLAELVKIDPEAIGVGQYQHDVGQTRLARRLDAVVEDCVNQVGVEVNTASEALLARVAGLTPVIAKNVVAHRDAHGAFENRRQLLKVARLGPKAFEQSAGFLRIRGGVNPLDASAVHPEAYPVVERIAKRAGIEVRGIVGAASVVRSLDPGEFVDDRFGLPTVTDIFAELEKPGRDPRGEFRTATFQDDVVAMTDLKPGQVLEGVVSNVTNFGAFVDIGVHQDGLVHISQLADRFVEDPRDVVKAGQIVTVKVLSVDVDRKRIALTMKQGRQEDAPSRGGGSRQRSEPEPPNPLAEQLRKLRGEGG